jgi:hypothetical protein
LHDFLFITPDLLLLLFNFQFLLAAHPSTNIAKDLFTNKLSLGCTGIIQFFGFLFTVEFVMKHHVSEKVPVTVFRKENNLLWWAPYIDIF